MEKGHLQRFLKSAWKKPAQFSHNELPSVIRRWLLYTGSFTKKGQTLLPKATMRIQILKEDLEMAPSSSFEYQLFRCHYIYVREIKIFLGDYLLMFARSVMPKTAPANLKHQFRGLGHQPLGHLLFGTKNIQRSSFEVAKFFPNDREFCLVTSNGMASPFLWARRATFCSKVSLLLLTEVFSPALIKLILNHETYPSPL